MVIERQLVALVERTTEVLSVFFALGPGSRKVRFFSHDASNLFHDPRIEISQHLGVEFVTARVLPDGCLETGNVKES